MDLKKDADRDFGTSDCSSSLPPEWPGDVRDPKVGCWHVLDTKPNSTTSDPVHCRQRCVDGSRYCEQHQHRMTERERREYERWLVWDRWH